MQVKHIVYTTIQLTDYDIVTRWTFTAPSTQKYGFVLFGMNNGTINGADGMLYLYKNSSMITNFNVGMDRGGYNYTSTVQAANTGDVFKVCTSIPRKTGYIYLIAICTCFYIA